MQVGMLKIEGMNDNAAAHQLAAVLQTIRGVESVEVSLDKSKASVSFDEELVSLQRLKVAVQEAGFALARPAHAEGGCCGGCGG
jgi:Copper chaperone